MLRKWDISDPQAAQACVDEILTRIDEQDGNAFGLIAAQELIDIVASHIGPSAYNAGIEDAKKAIEIKLADLEVDVDLLKITT